ncbi:hypothetical protein AAL_07069 [Moelleriella libera RCEF 2490]|uniref:Integral membrane protein n=1 Tax=Moelleriella libera RCEF 2490 TaxID=1081109 RepID=A0A162IAQ2_9HYPO|nr:hypothetical protein AAL_07069 [Moelleriella libera RCEF 2490]
MPAANTTVTRHRPATALDTTVAAGILVAFGLALAHPWARHTPLYEALYAYFPGGESSFAEVVRYVARPVMAVHALEPFVFARFRLRRHGVEVGTRLWWRWMTSVLVEGLIAWRRFEAVLEEEETTKTESRKAL